MEVKSVSGAIGGVVSNIDLTQPLTAADLRSLRQALLDAGVLEAGVPVNDAGLTAQST